MKRIAIAGICAAAIWLVTFVALRLLPPPSPQSVIWRIHCRTVEAIQEDDREALADLVNMQSLGPNEESVRANLAYWKQDVWAYSPDDVVCFLHRGDRAYCVLPWRDGEGGVSAKDMPYKLYAYVKTGERWRFDSRFGINPGKDNPTARDWEEALFPDLSDEDSSEAEAIELRR